MNKQNNVKSCHNCKRFINTTMSDDLFICGNCNFLNLIIIDADNEKCKYFINKFNEN